MCPYGPLLNEQTIGCSGTLQRDLCSATRNQTFRGGDEKLLFSCANFVDQTKSASPKLGFFDGEVRSNLPFLKRAEIVFLLAGDSVTFKQLI